MRTMPTVLVVDDELKIARLIRDYLEQAGFVVATAADGKGAIASARQLKPDLIVLDLGLPNDRRPRCDPGPEDGIECPGGGRHCPGR